MRLKTTLFLFINFLYFSQVDAQSCSGADFEERNGLAVVQLDAKTTSGWVKRSESGSSGGQTLYYNGSNSFNNPPGRSVLTYKVKVNSPGTYRVIIRNKIGIISKGPEPATSEHNDLWLKINGSEFFGLRGSSKIWPKGSGRTPNPAGASGNGYLKVYTNKLGWNWTSFTNDGPGHLIYVKFNKAGIYNVQIGGRSNGYFADKLALYKEGSVSQSAAQSSSATPCDGTPPPAQNKAPTVRISSPTNGRSFKTGSTFSVALSANDSDGSITKHEIFVNGIKVDTDGSSYSPYLFANPKSGPYTIKATVTDNDGATASSSINITINGTVVPPPPPPKVNNAPTVSITSPGNGQNITVGSTVTVGLSASDSDGSIAKHEVFVNGKLVDTDGVSFTPYKITNIQAGSYAIKATVTDNEGKKASKTVTISVPRNIPPPPPPAENTSPIVRFTKLSSGQNITAGSTVSVAISANDADGRIVKHEIFVNGTKVDTDGASYTPHPIVNIRPGKYAIQAKVTDNDGKTGTSTVNITVGAVTPPPSTENVAPVVSFKNLRNGQILKIGSTVSIDVKASDTDGRVTKHQIFVNGLLVDTDGTFFTPHRLVRIAAGKYTIKVTVTDNDGASASSTVIVSASSGTPPPTTPSITFNLINASSNASIGALVDGATISASKTGNVNIRVNAPSGTARVEIGLSRSGKEVKAGVENFAPYAVFGDLKGDYYGANLGSGTYTLIATAYSSSGSALVGKTITFTVGSGASKSAFLYPNPIQADGRVSVRLPEGSSGKFTYSIGNSLGVQVEQGSFDAVSSQRDVQLSLPNIGRQVQGVYYLTLISSESMETIPLIKH